MFQPTATVSVIDPSCFELEPPFSFVLLFPTGLEISLIFYQNKSHNHAKDFFFLLQVCKSGDPHLGSKREFTNFRHLRIRPNEFKGRYIETNTVFDACCL